MAKHKIGLNHKIVHIFTYHPWLKLISLILAIIVWLYIKDEMALLQ